MNVTVGYFTQTCINSRAVYGEDMCFQEFENDINI